MRYSIWSLCILTLLVFVLDYASVVETKVQRGQKEESATGRSSSSAGSKSASGSSSTKRSGGKRTSQEDDDDDDNQEEEKRHQESTNSRGGQRGHQQRKNDDDEESIEDVDEDKIDDIVDDNEKNLVIIFYDSNNRCPHCREALKEVEEIDDDLEAAGYIEVVKSDDKKVARELGIHVFPALVYYRRKNPILYDGEFGDSEAILKWIRAHEYVATEDLDDDNFEEKTDSFSPSEGALDWFVMFYNSKQEECNAYVPVWETVAHKLRGIVHIGKVDVAESDDVAQRFHVDDDDCPSFLFFRRGKMYRYKETARDAKSFVNFALYKFKETRGHRVPDPPTLLYVTKSKIEGLYEDVKEEIQEKLGEHTNAVLAVGGSLLVTTVIAVAVWATRSIRSRGKADEKKD